MEECSDGTEKEERPGASVKKTSEAGDDSMRRTTGAQGRSTRGNPETGGDSGLVASPPGRRRERYIIGTRIARGGQANRPTFHGRSLFSISIDRRTSKSSSVSSWAAHNRSHPMAIA